MLNGCFAALHIRCKWYEIPCKNDVIEWLEAVKYLLNSINENSNRINARSYIKDYDEEFKIYAEMLSNIDEKVRYFKV